MVDRDNPDEPVEHFGERARAQGRDALAQAAGVPAPQERSIHHLLPELKLLIGLATAGLIIGALYFGREILMPLALALLLGFMLDPLVVRLRHWGLPRMPAVVVVVVFALTMLGLAGAFLGSQVSSLSTQLPTYQSNIKTKLRDLRQSANKPGLFDGAVKTYDTFKHEVEGTADAKRGAGPPPPQRVEVEPRRPAPLEQAVQWLEASSGPLAQAGIVLVFMVLILLDRLDLRDRLLRLWGGTLHRSTDAMDEAGRRISRYLTMQLVVNLSYGVPMAAGLWIIGVPGAILWGAVAAVMRFVPYVGPLIASIFPVVLAFAVDPGWTMVLWVIGLIVVLELVSNNLIEPWLYGASTGLSAMSLMVAATFWTALWGPVGLIMSTPLTVCLLVIGRHLPRLKFLDVLLGSQPALDTPSRIYQRVLAGDVDEAIELAAKQVADADLVAFYDASGLPVLRMASSDHTVVATAEHRHRVVVGMDALLDALRADFSGGFAEGMRPTVVCIGGKWEVDTLAAKMLAHALTLQGQHADHRPAATLSADYIAGLDLTDAQAVCLSYFSTDPREDAAHFCRRLRRRWPDVKIVLALWNAPPELLTEDASSSVRADAVVTSMSEAIIRLAELTGVNLSEGFVQAPVLATDPKRLEALNASGALDARAKPIFDLAAKHAADIFDVPMAMVSLIDATEQITAGSFGNLPMADAPSQEEEAQTGGPRLPRSVSLCGHVVADARTLVVPDLTRDLRFAGNPAVQARGMRFYAGAALRNEDGLAIGTLCILDVEAHTLSKREVHLLESMATDVMEALREAAAKWGEAITVPVKADQVVGPTAIVGQLVPMPEG
ncbi:AI-2E family transporter [Variovorax sp. J22R133]|uniref:AI-2E family transporter n=1 Tax=Variovorax brevis TaxID=3053503 RepID=UPI0025778DDB|nr:AI-2E family transporter [Variovorax sp. J22R133]MDM0115469.1 AI-2E family transporter [Variovorax sp. J22R133]